MMPAAELVVEVDRRLRRPDDASWNLVLRFVLEAACLLGIAAVS